MTWEGVGKMKVAIIVPVFCTGGAENMAAQLAVHLDKSKVDVEVISMYPRQGHPFEKKIEEAGIPIHYMDKKGHASLGTMIRLWKCLSRMKPDVVHTHIYATFYAIPWVLTHRAKQVHTIHTKPDEEFPGILFGCLRLCSKLRKLKLVVISKANQQIACKAFRSTPEEYPCVNNPVELSRFYSGQKNPENVTFVSVGRLNPVKNFSLALRAMPRVLSQVPNARVVIVGDGELAGELREEARELGVAERVIFAGEQSRPEDFLAVADVYLLTSHVEGLPLSVLEAMASGLPVISTNVGGMPDLVKENGTLIGDDDMDALAREMIRFAKDGALRERCGRESLKMVKEYAADRCAKAYLEIYNNICNRTDAEGGLVEEQYE